MDASTASLEQKIWIFPKGGQHRVFPSPKSVRKGQTVTFVNMTDQEVTIGDKDTNGKRFLQAPVSLTPWNGSSAPPEQSTAAIGDVGPHEYKVTVGKTLARGGYSDPDIIIDP
jgi:hypothetical protein